MNSVTAMICPPKVSSFLGYDNCKLVPNFPNDMFSNELKGLDPDGHISIFNNVNLVPLLHHNSYMK